MSKKRDRATLDSPLDTTSPNSGSLPGDGGGISTTNFRNVSACNRCRNRKNRCDQKLPRCSGCERANVKCVGFDPVSKREIPRSYVYYLETRVTNLEAILRENGVAYPPPSEDFSISDAIKPGFNVPFPAQDDGALSGKLSPMDTSDSALDPALRELDSPDKLDRLVDNIGMVSVQGTSDARLQPSNNGNASGIPFSRVVFAAVKSSVSHTPAERASTKPTKQLPSATASGGGGSSSFFALHTKPLVKPAPFPDKAVGHRLVELYFEHANPQIPILHRAEFMSLFDRVYATDSKKRTARELYLVNIVFAIGSGIIMDSPNVEQTVSATESAVDAAEPPNKKRQRLASQQHQPEEYHSAAISHLDSFLGSTPAAAGVGGGLEELQAVLLLAGLALLRPVAPGLWYIIGVAVRLAIDLGLHFEDADLELDSFVAYDDNIPKSLGRRQWTRDLKRRLWWCTYNFDRLVSTCVGRPFGIADHVITTAFPSLLDDAQITTAGFLRPPNAAEAPSYKFVARHYFRLRLLQSEILQVLQHRSADQARAANAINPNRATEYMRTELSVPYLEGFDSFRDWRANVDMRLREWKDSAPQQFETGVAFESLFLELNYWQAIIMLYRQSLAVPEPLAGEMSPSTGEDVHSPGTQDLEKEELVFMKVAQAGQTVLKIYRQLHRLKLVNYTFLATHHLFMSGISFLYAIWHSKLVRSQLTLDDVDFTVLIATSVLTDLVERCPPAEACKDAFVRMSKATISMCMSTTGFGNASTLGMQPLNSPGGYFSGIQSSVAGSPDGSSMNRRKMPMPKFDMNLKDLFSEEEIANRPRTHRPTLQGNQRLAPPQRSPYQQTSMTALSSVEQKRFSSLSKQSSVGAAQYQPQQSFTSPRSDQGANLLLSNQQPYQPFAETISDSLPDFSFDNLDFLDTFPVANPSQIQWGSDLGFGTGGTAGGYGEGPWEANDGVDLFDGFFFGGNGNGNGTGL